ncbi:hypothetical protein SAMD00019534_018450 [Acytostelium subglobosum LB1]|uniref:hypothetical protein n=1 Tax=Acytostelium subglobosum LB1 TaxID=1410327 RepID=UPI0006449075|nr:hypothetical protein SAMD00019534_018450 [Acytostelium subglobosum LB1]GAM18670.1 hypothetical protein SAMD00019534_018450 [Acytostelium subglobosum LB1]|eukprot:XP_012757890.1 hypothetical protein SAMD00019534_018450 [Acytostelium subglobosum LB1]
MMSWPKLEALLDKSFPYIGFEELKSIPMKVMQLMQDVPFRFLKKLSETPELYEQCPLEVKRQIWLINEQLFREKLLPLMHQYVEDPYLLQDLNELLVETLLLPSKRREGNAVLQEIAELVGKSFQLYTMAVDYIKELYQHSGNPAFCTLRADLLMWLHDANLAIVYDQDCVHSFAWCVDACMREDTVDTRRVREIQSYFASLAPGKMLSDVAMVFANPFATHCLVRNVLRHLVNVVQKKQIPKDDENIKYITLLITLSYKAHMMLRDEHYVMPHIKKPVMASFYPILASQILDDLSRQGTDQPTDTEEEVDANLTTLFNKNSVCQKIMCGYIAKRVNERDTTTVDKYLKFISAQAPHVATADHSFIQSLVTQVLCVKDAKMSTVVIEDFLLKYKHLPFVQKQLLRYLQESQARMSQRDLQTFTQRLFTFTDGQAFVNDNSKLNEDILMMSKSILEKAGPRLNEKVLPLLLDFINSLQQLQHTQQQQQHQNPQMKHKVSTESSPSMQEEHIDIGEAPTSTTPGNTDSPNEDVNILDDSPPREPLQSSEQQSQTSIVEDEPMVEE